MSELVFAGATAHTGLMVRAADRVRQEQRASIDAGFDRFSRELLATRPEALVVIAPDHFATFPLTNLPTFAIGYGPGAMTWGDAGVPAFSLTYADTAARALASDLVDQGFDVSTAYNMRLDHAVACPVHIMWPGQTIPIIPVFINCAAEPMPKPERCFELGRAIRRAIERMTQVDRVAVLATGGLSHWTPAPRVDKPKDTLDQEMVDFLLVDDRAGFAGAMRRRVDEWSDEIRGGVAVDFDRELLRALETGTPETLFKLDFESIERLAGNGGQEIRTWITGAGVASGAPGETFAYEPVAEWLTGIGIFRWSI